MAAERCEDCKYFEVVAPGFGRCHRYPPTLALSLKVLNEAAQLPGDDIPPVRVDGWCGEFKPAPGG